MLHPAAHHGSPQVRIAGQVIADDDEFEIGIRLIALQFRFQRGKRLDHAYHILVSADSPRIQEERVRHLVTLGDQLAVGGAGVAVQKAFVDGVVNHLNVVGWNLKQLLDFVAGKIRHGKNARRPASTRLVI